MGHIIAGEVGGADDGAAREGEQQTRRASAPAAGDLAFEGLDFLGFARRSAYRAREMPPCGAAASRRGRHASPRPRRAWAVRLLESGCRPGAAM